MNHPSVKRSFRQTCRLPRFLVFAWIMGCAALPGGTADEAWRSYIKAHAVALPTANDPIAAAMLEAMSKRELVLLGEMTHGTREAYTWRAAITRALVRDAGFRYVAVEGDWTAIDPLDRYVRMLPDAPADARTALAGIDRWAEWMWANPEILELAEWLRQWNAEKPAAERVGIHGMDVYGWGRSAERLADYLERLEPAWGGRASAGLAPLQAFRGESQAYARAVSLGAPTGAAKLEAIRARLKARADSFKATDAEAFHQAKQQAGLLARAKAHMRKSVEGNPRSWNPRAENFHATVERLRDYYGKGARGVVWAHNTHIGDSRHTPMREAGLVTIGRQAREALGEDAVFLLGFSSHQGNFRAGERWEAPGKVIGLTSSLTGSIDRWLADEAPERAFLPLADARKDQRLHQAVGHRAIGVVHAAGTDSSRNYVPSNIVLRYDGILFIRDTTALAELRADAAENVGADR